VVEAPGAVAQEFERFAAQHTAQWVSEGRPGHFHAWPNALAYNRELVKAHGRLGRVRFVRLLLGDQVIANQYTFAFGRNLFAELPSRAIGPEWERLSLGCSSQVKLLDYAITSGFQSMRSGLGHYDYKVLLGGKEHRALMVRIESKGHASRLKSRVYSGARNVLHFACNKVWYQRLSARLPRIFRSSKAKIALRYDF
jgi:CelD/BcsL family acetyltransferase involved in cellulose biosynthesis